MFINPERRATEMKYNTENCSVELTVRSLCALALSSGDLGGINSIDCDSASFDRDMLRILQAESEGFYNTEVTLSNTNTVDGICFTVSERADGIIRKADGSVEVDVSKCAKNYEFALPPREYLLARLKCFAYFLCVRDGMDSIRGRISYINPESKKTKYYRYRLEREALKEFYLELLSKISGRARVVLCREVEGKPSAASAPFPYPELREGQEMMIRECYSAIKREKRIFVEAPTGTGKTVSSLYPAVRALGEGHIDKIFYLTAKASTRREAYLAAEKLFRAGAMLKTVVISAKEQVCACGYTRMGAGGKNPCNPIDCPYARGYYDRVGGALDELLSDKNGYPRQLICNVAKKHSVCPYELSLDLSEYCDIIICDYNYAFDPMVYFRRYFSDCEGGGRYAFLVDEAHNLADRARDMYSATVKRSEILMIRDMVGAVDSDLKIAADSLIMAITRQRNLCKDSLVKDGEGNEMGFYLSRSPLESLNKEIDACKKKCDGWLKKNKDHPIYGELNGLCSSMRRYLAVNEYFDKGFLCYVEILGGDISVKTYCLDPSPTMNGLLSRAKASVLFSATLTPAEYFCDVLGGSKNSESLTLPSPFDPENLCVSVVDYLSVRSEDRKKNYAKYATVIAATVSPMRGNYIAYFPSYECLEGVLEVFSRKYPKVEVIVQSRGMGTEEKERFLSAFREDRGTLRVGFCVLGGAFSEGVDLPGSRLIGSIIFGVGIPALSNERNIIKEYFDNDQGNGYDYAYTYPGMNRVLQAVGRVIRREGDRGIAVLVDDRYAEPKYRGLFPKHWEGVQYAGNARSLAEIMRRFWENSGDCK